MNLFAPRKIYTVSEITADVKACLESEFSEVCVEGEISNLAVAASGHLYFGLKDKGAQIRCVCFRGRARFLKFRAEDGLQVIASGDLSVYEPRGDYQLIVDFMEPKGLGSLQLAFEQLKARLQAEGLFDARYKKPLPVLPICIGIVTSPTGAAIQDILRILRRRHESVRVLIYPARVQGQGAAAEIAAGIRALNRLADVDVMIVGRGGGSLEDLWAFNEEIVARAIFESRIPVISAVGHEVDFSISDFVADLRAPTPSAAAELVVSQKSEMLERVAGLDRRLQQSLQFHLSRLRNRVLTLTASRVFASAEGRLGFYRQRLDELAFRLEYRLRGCLKELKGREQLLAADLGRFDLWQMIRLRRETVGRQISRLQAAARLFLQSTGGKVQRLESSLRALSPLAVLERGYAICRDSQGNIIREATALQKGDPFSVRLAKGVIDARAEKIHESEA
ncbi:MAG: exodeoxyribonuclease VII large subunit [Acidobacteria bacterium]|nr:exodeoxyribonuclease VII large subunit [Acidobacteriota bacterium]